MVPTAPSDVPFAPRRLPFHYAWVVVAAATGGVLCSIPGQTMGVSAFTESLLGATGLERLTLSNAYLVGTLASAALLPRAGVLIDRFGVRVAAMLAALLLGLVLLLLARADALAAWIASAVAVEPTAAAVPVLAALFTGLRFAGQGTLTLASNTMLGRWFRHRRGLATALQATAVSFGFAAAPWLFDAWIGTLGWRGAWERLAWIEIGGASLWALVLFRETPEACGLSVDAGLGRHPRASGEDEAVATRAEALRTRAFWLLATGLAVHGMFITGITLHVVDIGAENGLGRDAALGLFLPIAVASTTTGAVVGWLADRASIRGLLSLFLVAQAVGFAATAHVGSDLGHVLTVVGLGVSGGHFAVLSAVGHPRFFGRRHLGAIAGASMSLVVVGSALGPTVLAASRTLFDSYRPALYAAACVPLVLGIGLLRPLHANDRAPLRRA